MFIYVYVYKVNCLHIRQIPAHSVYDIYKCMCIILKAITDELDNTCYAIIGDWNTNLCDIDNSLFAGPMINFCSVEYK